jgi:hypothetical protein
MRDRRLRPITVSPVNAEDLYLEYKFHTARFLRNFNIRYAPEGGVQYLVDHGEKSHLAEVDASILSPNEEVASLMRAGDFCDITEIDAYFQCSEAMHPNPYPQMFIGAIEGIAVAVLEDCGNVFSDSGYIPVPAWENSLFKITPWAFMQAYLTPDKTHVLIVPSSLAYAERITELPGNHLVCPEGPGRLRCCVTCGHSKGEEVCKFKILGLRCCKFPSKETEITIKTV